MRLLKTLLQNSTPDALQFSREKVVAYCSNLNSQGCVPGTITFAADTSHFPEIATRSAPIGLHVGRLKTLRPGGLFSGSDASVAG
jgi:hypothetical protein